jgi:hypothetical protein
VVGSHAVLPDWQLKVLEDRSLLLWDAFFGVRPVEGMDLGFYRHQSNFLPIFSNTCTHFCDWTLASLQKPLGVPGRSSTTQG